MALCGQWIIWITSAINKPPNQCVNFTPNFFCRLKMKSLISCSTVARLLLLFSIPGSLLIAPIGGQPSSSSSSHGHHQHRRSPMGFEGVRGKRSLGEETPTIQFQRPPDLTEVANSTRISQEGDQSSTEEMPYSIMEPVAMPYQG